MPMLTDDQYELLVEYAKGKCDEEGSRTARDLIRESQDAQNVLETIRPVEAFLRQLGDACEVTDQQIDDGWNAIEQRQQKDRKRWFLRIGFGSSIATAAAMIAVVFLTGNESIGTKLYTSRSSYLSTDQKSEPVFAGDMLYTDNWRLVISLQDETEFVLAEQTEVTLISNNEVSFHFGIVSGKVGETSYTLGVGSCTVDFIPGTDFFIKKEEAAIRTYKALFSNGGIFQCEDGTEIEIPEKETFTFTLE